MTDIIDAVYGTEYFTHKGRPMRPSEVASTLEKAADLLDKKGWVRDWYQNWDGHRLDAFQAIIEVAPIRFMDPLKAASVEVGAYLGDWNMEQHDKRKVQRALRRTARHLRNRTIVRDGTNNWTKVR